MRRINIIESEYGDGAEFELEKSIQKTQIHLANSATSMLMAGRELVRIKEHIPHGDFQEVTEKRLGMSKRTCQRFMSAAVKFANTKQITSAIQGRSNLLELVTLDDDDLKALDEGGTVAGLVLDEIDSMTTSELREQLREHKENLKKERDSHQRMLARKDDKINELDKQLDGRKQTGWKISTEMINADVVIAAGKILEQIDVLNNFREEIVVAGNDLDDAEYASMAITYHDASVQAFDAFNQLLSDSDEVFGPVKNQATAIYEK